MPFYLRVIYTVFEQLGYASNLLFNYLFTPIGNVVETEFADVPFAQWLLDGANWVLSFVNISLYEFSFGGMVMLIYVPFILFLLISDFVSSLTKSK